MSTPNRYDTVARASTVRRIYLQNGPWCLDPRQTRAKPGRRGKAVACRCRHSCRPGSQNGADHHVARIVHGFTIGMCYQVSDATLRNPQIRHTVLAHAVLSYVFGVVIVAGSVNLISRLFR